MATTQIAVKLPEELLTAIDALVSSGRFDSRSSAVRAGLKALIRDAERSQIDTAFAEGFRRMPESEDELAEARRLAIQSIEEEPWERWW